MKHFIITKSQRDEGQGLEPRDLIACLHVGFVGARELFTFDMNAHLSVQERNYLGRDARVAGRVGAVAALCEGCALISKFCQDALKSFSSQSCKI